MRFDRCAPARASVHPRLSLLCGGALAAAAAVVGCSEDTTSTAMIGASAGTAGAAGSAGGGGTASVGGGGGGAANAGTSSSVGTAGASASGGMTSNAGMNSGGASGSAGSAGAASGAGGVSGSGGVGGSGGAGVAACPGGGTTSVDPTGDSDNDGILNCVDGCPDDPNKKEAGVCGCGNADIDTDNDGKLDCEDACPADAMKTEAGICGCGRSDTANADGDAAVDCQDECPKDPALTKAGACGCLPEALGVSCLAHRYQFSGTGSVITDAIAGASGNGTAVGATLSGSGTLVLTGGTSDQYVSLPAGLISALGNSATFEAWLSWSGSDGGDWQRIFDFGSSSAGAGMQGDGQGYVFLTPRAAGAGMRTAISMAGGGTDEDLVTAASALPAITLTHVAVVIDGKNSTLSLYQNGVSQGTPAAIRPATRLVDIVDANNWLGRSQYSADEELAGTFDEVRIYSKALSAEQIAASFAAGPDALP